MQPINLLAKDGISACNFLFACDRLDGDSYVLILQHVLIVVWCRSGQWSLVRSATVRPHSLVMRVGRNSDGAVPGRNSGAVPVRHSGEGRDSALELQLSEVPFTGRGYPLRLGAGDRAREEAQGYQQQRPAARPSHSLCRDRR